MTNTATRTTSLLSIVVPVYNEAKGVNYFHNTLLLPEVKKATKGSFEIIYVNDGSSDATLNLLTAIARKDKKVRIVTLSRNFGKEIATTAGIGVAKGDAIIIMDGDGQHPPALLKDFLKEWHSGAQVVVGVRNSNQKEGVIKKWGSKAFYRLFNSMSESAITPRSTDYRLIDKVVQKEFLQLTERNRITRGLIDWLGFERAYVPFDSPARIAGQASYTFQQLTRLALNSFISLSLRPLYFFGWVGLVITFLSLILGIFILIEQVLLRDPLGINVTGTAMLGVFTSFLVGLVLTSQGMIAVYLAHVHSQTQGRPLFVINSKNSINLE